MLDPLAHRAWTDHHAAFSDEVGGVLSQIGIALRALNRYQFDAPWKRDARTDNATAPRCA